MPSKMPQNHKHAWSDLLNDLDISSWWQVITFLYQKEHGYSNYHKCSNRNFDQIKQDVYQDKRIQQYLEQEGSNDGEVRQKFDKILDEMCHLLPTQTNPTRRLKFAGVFFLKCITQIYSSIYVNNRLLANDSKHLGINSFKEEFMKISQHLPIVILPTHRSYMDFLFISYIMTHYELPLPIVATGDNFKAMGNFLLSYLKSTGAFVVRRGAQTKKDVDSSAYYDLLRAYVHSILKGGENPLEFFMEGTRTRVGQVLRPKTGLLSMVVDSYIDKIVEDVYIMPVAINYQRPIEEQLYVAENTPQIGMKKPKENAKNLFNAFDAIMKRKYGKVYVRFLEPFKLSEYFDEWKRVTSNSSTVQADHHNRETTIKDFTNSLASKVCLAQANNNILMPFNLIACSILSRSFFQEKKPKLNGYIDDGHETNSIRGRERIPFADISSDFNSIELALQTTQSQFVPGWEKHLEIFEEFQLDRDGIVQATADRRHIEFMDDAPTFQTLLYYSNQVVQTLLPVAICSLLMMDNNGDCCNQWEQYRFIRNLLLNEFFSNESFMKQEFEETVEVIKCNSVAMEARTILIRHLRYYVKCYLFFLNYLKGEKLFERNKFFQHQGADGCSTGNKQQEVLYISKDMLKNMTNLVKDLRICEPSVPTTSSGSEVKPHHSHRPPDETLLLIDEEKLNELRDQFEQVLQKTTVVI